MTKYVCLMADYNQWMNQKIFEACSQLTSEQLGQDRKAFFGSIIGTLNHIAVADTIWLKRFTTALSGYPALDPISELPAPAALDAILHPELNALAFYRQQLDGLFLSMSHAITDNDLAQTITYTNTKGTEFSMEFFGILMHVFNHQTHHRGQVTTLLSQFDVDIGVTDLLAKVPRL